MTCGSLPKFERPPVIETVLGVQFGQLPNLTNAHLGAFWKHLSPDWSIVSDAPPLPFQFESFGEERWLEPGLKLAIRQGADIRVQIRNERVDRMVQLQNGRFHYNWLGEAGGAYPRYKTVQPEFHQLLDQFKDFLGKENLGSMVEEQWEVTYVNHIPAGPLWSSVDDFADVFRPLAPAVTIAGGARLTNFGGEWSYDIEPRMGRLHVRVHRGRKRVDRGSELLIITLTARGPIGKGESGAASLAEGLDLGRETIVKVFYELTTERAHEHWGEIA